jgi:hypothetical protein
VLNWVLEQFGCYLPVTHRKDPDMLELWDDRVVPVRRNTGLTDAEYTMQQMRHQRQHHQGAD